MINTLLSFPKSLIVAINYLQVLSSAIVLTIERFEIFIFVDARGLYREFQNKLYLII